MVAPRKLTFREYGTDFQILEGDNILISHYDPDVFKSLCVEQLTVEEIASIQKQ